MNTSNSKIKFFDFLGWGLVAAAALTLSLAATALLFTGCPNAVNAPGTPTPPGKVIFTLDAGKPNIGVRVKTFDGNPITVEGCTEKTFNSDVQTELHANGTTVTLKGYITELECSNNELTAIDVQGCTTLQWISCSGNRFTSLNMQGLTALKKLECNNNGLTTLNVQGCTSLQTLSCSINELEALNVQGLTALQELGCRGNKLTALNVQGCASLQTLSCGSNELTALNAQDCASLRNLQCASNKLRDLVVQGCTSLQVLVCDENKQLNTLDVSRCTALYMLECSGNQLETLNVSGCTALKEINCYSNKLNAAAMTKLLTALPARNAIDGAVAKLYTEYAAEGNHKDFDNPATLKTAYEGAKGRKWKLKIQDTDGSWVEI